MGELRFGDEDQLDRLGCVATKSPIAFASWQGALDRGMELGTQPLVDAHPDASMCHRVASTRSPMLAPAGYVTKRGSRGAVPDLGVIEGIRLEVSKGEIRNAQKRDLPTREPSKPQGQDKSWKRLVKKTLVKDARY